MGQFALRSNLSSNLLCFGMNGMWLSALLKREREFVPFWAFVSCFWNQDSVRLWFIISPNEELNEYRKWNSVQTIAFGAEVEFSALRLAFELFNVENANK